MDNPSKPADEPKELLLRLSDADFRILEKFRGEMTPEAFVSALLRMIDSGAVVNTPEWVKIERKK